MQYLIINTETGAFIEEFNTYDEAYIRLQEFEADDKFNGTFVENFYSITKDSFDIQFVVMGEKMNLDFTLTYDEALKYVFSEKIYINPNLESEVKIILKESQQVVWRKKSSSFNR